MPVKIPGAIHFRTVDRLPPAIPPSDRADQENHEHPGGVGYYSVTMVRFREGSEPMVLQVNIGVSCKGQLYAGSYDYDMPITMWPVASLELIMDEAFNNEGVWAPLSRREDDMNETDRSWGENASPAD